MSPTRWPSDWMRGVLPLSVLAVVAEGETYGYAVGRRLHEAGLGAVKGGTLYPVLMRLEQEGLLRSWWQAGDGGPGRKFFALTGAGRDALERRAGEWRSFTEQVAGLLPTRTESR